MIIKVELANVIFYFILLRFSDKKRIKNPKKGSQSSEGIRIFCVKDNFTELEEVTERAEKISNEL